MPTSYTDNSNTKLLRSSGIIWMSTASLVVSNTLPQNQIGKETGSEIVGNIVEIVSFSPAPCVKDLTL